MKLRKHGLPDDQNKFQKKGFLDELKEVATNTDADGEGVAEVEDGEGDVHTTSRESK